MLDNATVRLAVRAVLAGASVFVTSLQSADRLDKATIIGALVAGGWAALEVFTPLNSLVGYFKK